eukprot:scaffold4074_cov254-Prasinococcus_capsulatus_cf.AAC.3
MSDNNHAIAQEAIESGSAASQGQAQQEYIEFGMLRVGAAFSAPDSDDIDGPAVELAGSPPPRSFTARVQVRARPRCLLACSPTAALTRLRCASRVVPCR